MKKLMTIVAMVLMAIGTSAQDDGQLGYWNRSGFVEMIPDESVIYKYVLAMDDESQQTIEVLLADMREKNDKSILKRSEGGWYVRNDYPLPEGNYYISDFYNNDLDNDNQLYFILPRYEFYMNRKGNINDLLNFLGNTVTLESEFGPDVFGGTDYKLNCNLKTSEEVLELGMLVHERGFEGLPNFVPRMLWIDRDYNNFLIRVLTGNDKETDENGDILIYEMNWEGVDYPATNCGFGDYPWKPTDEGLGIINSQIGNWFTDLAYPIALEQNHDYIVRLTIKAPSDGTYGVGFGKFLNRDVSKNTWFYREVPVTASEDFQVIDVECVDFASKAEDEKYAEDGCVMLDCGRVLGTTIVKKVEVYEKLGSDAQGNTTGLKVVKATNADGAIYNLAGQKVDASYKGIVIQNGKKRIAR